MSTKKISTRLAAWSNRSTTCRWFCRSAWVANDRPAVCGVVMTTKWGIICSRAWHLTSDARWSSSAKKQFSSDTPCRDGAWIHRRDTSMHSTLIWTTKVKSCWDVVEDESRHIITWFYFNFSCLVESPMKLLNMFVFGIYWLSLTQAGDRRCLTEARVPNFNGEKGCIMT